MSNTKKDMVRNHDRDRPAARASQPKSSATTISARPVASLASDATGLRRGVAPTVVPGRRRAAPADVRWSAGAGAPAIASQRAMRRLSSSRSSIPSTTIRCEAGQFDDDASLTIIAYALL